ncbi:hypothetical protein FRC14_003246 [Serendipita sp. 396]|nr:hypothetical protein FRC14_003246 [Serendipita sp. 396]KAG8849635.1 hypothetical protein FRB91_009728 [Serendipita sp. 411]
MSMNSLFRRNQQPNPDNLDADTDEDDQIDPNLRLRTVRTAASTIAESIRSEQRMERRRIKRRRLWGSLKSKKSTTSALTVGEQRRDSSSGPTPSNKPRRNVYVNCNLAPQDKDSHGRPLHTFVRNKVKTTMRERAHSGSQNIPLLHLFRRIFTNNSDALPISTSWDLFAFKIPLTATNNQ